MGLFDNFFSSDKTSSTTSNSTTQANLPDWLRQYLDQNTKTGMSQLEQLANTTADQRIVGFSDDEIAAQNRIREGTGQYDDIIKGSLNALQQAQQQALTGDYSSVLQNYINPYTQNVIDISKRNAVQDADAQRAAAAQAAGAASGFGGSGYLLRQQAADKQLSTQLSDLQYKGLSDAYDKALSAAQQGTQTAINAAGQTFSGAQTGTNIYNQDTASLAASGESQRNLEQAKTDFTYTNPLQTTLQGSQLINANAGLYGTTTAGNTTSTTPGAGWGSQLLGGALAVGGLGTGGGSTIAGSLLTNWLGKKDGGVVKGYADGGSVSSDIQDKLNPLQRILPEDQLAARLEALQGGEYTPGTVMPLPEVPNDISFPDNVLQPPRMDEINIPTSRMEEIYGKQPLAESALTAMSSEQPVSQQKSRLQRMIDDTNLPLLKMGLTMMASDKPFFEAVGEGGLAAVGQIQKEREQEKEAAQTASKSALEKLIAQNQALDIQSKMERRNAQTQNEELTRPSKIAYNTEMTKILQQKAQTGLTLKNQLDSIDKEYANLTRAASSSFDPKEKAALQVQIQNNRAAREKLLGKIVSNNSGNNIQEDVNQAVGKQLDFSDLPRLT